MSKFSYIIRTMDDFVIEITQRECGTLGLPFGVAFTSLRTLT